MSITSENQVKLALAEAVANQVIAQLNPFCKQIGVVGSIRRKKQLVGDIEICCTPHKENGQLGFFENQVRRSESFIREVAKLGSNIKGNSTDGRYVQLLLYTSGIKLDLFMPQENDFYRIYAIRTGSADYSSRIIATAWKRLGWVGTEHGLRKEKYCLHDGNSWKWADQRPGQELPPAWQSEREFFDWLEVPYVKPERREVYH